MPLTVKELSFRYNKTSVLTEVSFTVNEGEVVAVLGPNGAGKSTLVKCIAGVLRPAARRVFIAGQDISQLRPMERARLIGYVPQASPDAFPFNVFETVLLGRRPYMGWSPDKEDLNAVAETLRLLDVAQFAGRRVAELSGGERQRVLLAQALARRPTLLLLDEPTANLDLHGQLAALGLVGEVVRKQSIAAVVVLHDVNLAARFADRIVFLRRGRVFAAGEPQAVLTAANVKQVYNVEAITTTAVGRPHIVPISPSQPFDHDGAPPRVSGRRDSSPPQFQQTP